MAAEYTLCNVSSVFVQVSHRLRPVLSGMVSSLGALSSSYPVEELASLAGDLRVCIATLGAVWSSEMKEKAQKLTGEKPSKEGTFSPVKQAQNDEAASSSSFKEGPFSPVKQAHIEEATSLSSFKAALQDLKDPLLPVRAHGIIALTRLIKTRDPETLEHFRDLSAIFCENLRHDDSYLYLAAINGLVALGFVKPGLVLPLLCHEYAQFNSKSEEGKPYPSFDKETGILYKTGSSTDRVHSKEKASMELLLKVGQALVGVASECGSTLPGYADLLLSSILSNACHSDPLLRASALSNLAEVCSLMGYSFGSVQHEVWCNNYHAMLGFIL